MIAGRGTPDQGPAHDLRRGDPEVFEALVDRITQATIVYLSAQIEAGAEVVKLFDSWAGSLIGHGDAFERWAVEPARVIAAALAERHPGVPFVAFPRGAGRRYVGLHAAIGADCVALDDGVDAQWAADAVQRDGCVQGNLAASHLVTGGEELTARTRAVVDAFRGGPHVFNLGHGITPDADPDNVHRMLEAVRQV